MIDLALDPSETRPAPEAAPRRAARRPWMRIALFGLLGVAGTGAFASVASTYLSGLAGPQRTPRIATSLKAADWPDLKDGLPALATGSLSAVPKLREIVPSEPAPPPVVEARIEPNLRPGSAAFPDTVAAPPVAAGGAQTAAQPIASKPVTPAIAARPLPAIVDVAVIGPARQAAIVAPARTVPGIAPLAGETVRAKTVSPETGSATYAALPPENAKGVVTNPATARDETAKPEIVKAKPQFEAHAKPPASRKPVADKSIARKPALVEATAVPVEAQDEDTEVFGIKVPSLAPAGRKLRESVEALGDAVKGIPDRF